MPIISRLSQPYLLTTQHTLYNLLDIAKTEYMVNKIMPWVLGNPTDLYRVALKGHWTIF